MNCVLAILVASGLVCIHANGSMTYPHGVPPAVVERQVCAKLGLNCEALSKQLDTQAGNKKR